MSNKYHVTRNVTLVQSIAIKAENERDAIEKSRKEPFKKWATVDRKRRQKYEAKKISY